MAPVLEALAPKKADWVNARRERQMREARLPPRLRSLFKGIRDESLQLHLLEEIDNEVERLLERQGHDTSSVSASCISDEERAVNGMVAAVNREVRGATPGAVSRVPGGKTRRELHPVVYYHAVRILAGDETFVCRLRRMVREALRRDHVVGLAPDAVTDVAASLPTVTPRGGVLVVPSRLGLGTASYLEGAPEGWDAWAVQEVTRRFGVVIEGDENGDVGLGLGADPLQRKVELLVLHAGPGGLARAVDAQSMGLPRCAIDEVDDHYSSPTSLACVRGRNSDTLKGEYDAVIAAIPSAADPAAAGQMRIYENTSPTRGADGPRAWLHRLQEMVSSLSGCLRTGGVALLLLPLGIRGRKGYTPAPDLEASVRELLREVPGLHVAAAYETREESPVRRPFVGTNRPKLITIVLEKMAGGEP